MARPYSIPQHFREAASTHAGSVLLEDSLNGTGRFFTNPVDILTLTSLDQIEHLFAQIEDALTTGHYVAGYLAYEAGFAFEPSLAAPPREPRGLPLAWFGVYRNMREVSGSPESQQLRSQPPSSLTFALDAAAYTARVEQIRSLIAQGDTYQANLTMPVTWNDARSPAEIFQHMMQTQPVQFGALINPGDTRIISASPELFFERNGASIVTRPMKGTSARGRWPAEDDALATALAQDEKNRAENLMIVDLLRNDLGRACEHGSIRVDKLFHVEQFPTLLQMTSTVTGTLRPDFRYAALFRALFPSGSIVGAPKIRTIQILREAEPEARGVYCGAIGFFAPNNRAMFSVAIRTLTLHQGKATMGVGSGITYDSDPAAEYAECHLKTAFVTQKPSDFELIETLLWDGQYTFLQDHLTRLAISALRFGCLFSRPRVVNALNGASQGFRPGTKYRVRLKLTPLGEPLVSALTIQLPEADSVNVLLSQERTNRADLLLFHKTTQRAIYDKEHARALSHGCADALFLNQQGEVTEGAIHNVITVCAGRKRTPPIDCGVLPGIFRAHLLSLMEAPHVEVILRDDLLRSEQIYLCNSVRGVRTVGRVLEEDSDGSLRCIWQSQQSV